MGAFFILFLCHFDRNVMERRNLRIWDFSTSPLLSKPNKVVQRS